jgi:hypothetical protein
MVFAVESVVLAVGLFLGMQVGMEIGRRIWLRRARRDPENTRQGTGIVEGAVFGLLGLLVAFTFSGAASRYDARRVQIVDEANTIGTAWLRLDLLPADVRPPLRDAFREYLDLRIELFRRGLLDETTQAGLSRQAELQDVIWKRAQAGIAQDGRPQIATLVTPALNEMFDIATSRTMATQIHVPNIIVTLLLGLAFLSSILAGFAMATPTQRNWLHATGFAAIMSLTVMVTYDLEFPRRGFIRLDKADQPLLDLQKSLQNAEPTSN